MNGLHAARAREARHTVSQRSFTWVRPTAPRRATAASAAACCARSISSSVAKLARSGTPPPGALWVRNLRYALITPPPVVDDTWRLLQGTGFACPS